jgi:hypothetical protein
MKMMELEVDIDFTSPFIVNETFFRRALVGNLLHIVRVPTICK